MTDVPHLRSAGASTRPDEQEVEVNSTARWPERLEQVAVLLRAEGAAILALQDGDVRTLFSYRLDEALSWVDVLGDAALQRALVDRGGFSAPIPAERWGESAAYALLAPITAIGSERGVLCAMRHSVPFDAVEVVAGEAAARLLSIAFADAQAAALGVRDGTAEAAPGRPVHVQAALPVRVVLIEAQPATRLGLETILAGAGLQVLFSCATTAEALARLPGLRCDVVLLGTLADATPSDAVRRVRGRTRAEIVVIAGPRRGIGDLAALRAGAVGQLAPDAAPDAVVAALRAALAGLATVDRSAVETLLDRPEGSEAPDTGSPASEGDVDLGQDRVPEEAPLAPVAGPARRRAADTLSPREIELLRYLAEGYTNKEIARVMVLADDTVKKGVQGLIAKLGAADRTHAVVLALRSRLIE